MTTSVVFDDNYLASVDPTTVRRLLGALGWERAVRQGDVLLLSNLYDEDLDTFLLPLRREMRGYEGQVRDILGRVSELRGMSFMEAVQRLDSVDRDIHLVSLNADGHPGRVRLEELGSSLEGIRSWVLACASSESFDDPRLVQPSRRPDRAIGFINFVEIAPTRPGSYILPVQVVLPPIVGQQGMDITSIPRGAPEPFERRVSARMYDAAATSLRIAQRVESREARLTSFSEAVGEGMCANLLEALSQIGGASAGRGFKLATTWSIERPRDPMPPLTFSPVSVAIFREAAEMIRSQTEEEPVTFAGNVTRLHRERNSGAGEVTVGGYVIDDENQRFRRVTLSIAEEDYSAAVVAHNDGNEVTVDGRLTRSGNRWRLLSPSNFRVLSAE